MHWFYLILAIISEILGTTFMKASEGLSKIIPTIGMVLAYILCFAMLSLALKRIPMSIAYAIWSAVGIVVISIIGIVFFKENINLIKVISILLIIVGVVGLNLSGINH